MGIGFFVPEETKARPLSLEELGHITGKSFIYAPKGRYALCQLIQMLCAPDAAVLMPAYFCTSTVIEIKKLGRPIVWYDVEMEDLNPSVHSIQQKLACVPKQSVVVVPSYYGNAADLFAIEQLCRDKGACMIDDAAQSFGATLGSRMVGTFGDAGMFAFSPGKATAGHMGALYWSNALVPNVCLTKHPLLHRAQYYNFKWNRVDAYCPKPIALRKAIGLAATLLSKVCYCNDRIEKFEEPLLGGYLWDNLERRSQRNEIRDRFIKEFKDETSFKILQNQRGNAHPCKIVLLFAREEDCAKMKDHLNKRAVSWFGGYYCEKEVATQLPNTERILNCVIELPLECNSQRMQELSSILHEYCAGSGRT